METYLSLTQNIFFFIWHQKDTKGCFPPITDSLASGKISCYSYNPWLFKCNSYNIECLWMGKYCKSGNTFPILIAKLFRLWRMSLHSFQMTSTGLKLLHYFLLFLRLNMCLEKSKLYVSVKFAYIPNVFFLHWNVSNRDTYIYFNIHEVEFTHVYTYNLHFIKQKCYIIYIIYIFRPNIWRQFE